MELYNDLIKKTFEFSNVTDDGKKKTIRKFSKINYDATPEEQMKFGESLAGLVKDEAFSRVYQVVTTASSFG